MRKKSSFLFCLLVCMIILSGCAQQGQQQGGLEPDATATTAPTETPTPDATATNTPEPTASTAPTETPTPEPTATNTPEPTASTAPTETPTPEPTATNTPEPTATTAPTETPTPEPTATNTPEPTATNTPEPTATNTPKPTATNTPKPTATNTPKPTATNTPKPTATPTPKSGIEFTSTKNVATESSFGGVVTWETVAEDGTLIKMAGEGVCHKEGSWITIQPGGRVYCLTPLGGIESFVTDYASNADNNTLELQSGYDVRVLLGLADESASYDDINWITWEILTDGECNNSYMDYFEIINPTDKEITIKSLSVEYSGISAKITSAKVVNDNYIKLYEGDFLREYWETYEQCLNFRIEKIENFRGEALDCFISYTMEDGIVFGDLKDTEGNVLDKYNSRVYKGYTLEVTLNGSYLGDYEIPFSEVITGMDTYHDMMPYQVTAAEGNIKILVIPIYWSNEKSNATEANRQFIANCYNDADNTNDWFTLEEYYEIASYGKMTVDTFVTEWYPIGCTLEDAKNGLLNDAILIEEAVEWAKAMYPEIDWSEYDLDGNGYFDSVHFVTSSEEIGDRTSFYDWATASTRTDYKDYAGTQDNPAANNIVWLTTGFLRSGDSHTLIHEFGHNLGMLDYYSWSSFDEPTIDILGGYDMMSYNVGDWNPFSKFAVGWIDPVIVDGSKESLDIKIESFAKTGDAIVIPAYGTDYDGTPFAEYIMIDLFTPDGVNMGDAESYGIGDTTGVRILHVDARYHYLDNASESGEEYFYVNNTMETIHYGTSWTWHEDYKNKTPEEKFGFYVIEMIQPGNVNTFTGHGENRAISTEDFFTQGETFSVADYTEFFYDGVMNDGTEWGYTITVKELNTSAETPYAVITVTRTK